jgi:lipopolysaccharide/colanic/teichoic acid biosynthesis glycosyltransferase
MLILKLTGEGEIFYFQERVGLNNKTIKIFKFATMLKNSEQMGSGIYTAKNDPRILPFGNFLRKTKINELPQIINILNGDISLVGPRPLIRKTFELYNDEEQKIIFSMKPGLTGIGSIVFRNEEEILNNANMDLEEFYEKYITPYKAQLELWYKKNQSFLCDLQIIFLTSWAILFKESRLPWIIFKDLPNQREI